MKKIIFAVILSSLLMSCWNDRYIKEKDLTEHDKKMGWWREARFGMFIHWGLYAVPAGEWRGKQVPGISEWIMARAEIPVKEYELLTKEFNPVNYNADEWVKLAKAAGMKYIVITSKHHDGFAMFDSDASNYNIVDATPFKRDPLKELAKACLKYDVKLGFYYSQAQDWHEPGGTYWNIESGEPHWDESLNREPLLNYIDNKAVPQVKEILENYDGLDILWWDTPRGMTEEAAQKLQDVVDDYPDLITNNRLYKPWPGDFSTPEQHVPPTGLDYDWEVCMTMNTSWGFKRNDNEWKSAKELIRMLADIASKGGNFLLNVGPTAEGEIPAQSVERLKEIGSWMKKNSESIYGTTASPFFKLPWGRCTKRIEKNRTKLYLHVFDWPKDNVITVPGIKAWVRDIYLLSYPNHKFPYTFKDGNLLIHVPMSPVDKNNTVFVVDTRGSFDVKSNMPSLSDGKILLPADFGDIHNRGYGVHAQLSLQEGKPIITNWVDPSARIEWMFNTEKSGTYEIWGMLSGEGKSQLNVSIDEEQIEVNILLTNEKFEKIKFGEVKIGTPGNKDIELKPNSSAWSGFDLMHLELKLK